MKSLFKIIIVLKILLLSSLYAAEQGGLIYGDKSINSSGNLNIQLRISDFIQVNNLNDIDLGKFNFNNNKSGNDDFCVFSNSDSFSLTLYGSNNSFELSSKSNSNLKIDYNVNLSTLNTYGNTTSKFKVYAGRKIKNIEEKRNSLNCYNQYTGKFEPNLNLEVIVDKNNMLDAIPDNYKDIITIIASPE